MSALAARQLLRENTLFFLCDVQTRFRDITYGFGDLCNIANKMIKFAKLLECPVVVTEQNPKGLGPTAPEIDLESLGDLHLGTFSKTAFSMVVPPVQEILKERSHINSVVLFGIESHVCVLQTALDLLNMNYAVHVVVDGVSSGSRYEVPYALSRIRAAGGVIGTSDSIGFQLMRDASHPNFKAFSKIVKDEMDKTRKAGDVFLRDGVKSAL